jgi:[ribosomal protein S18]-alanine N-acetyltransferase
LSVRPVENRDIDAILAIQSACPDIAQWTPGDYAGVARGQMAGWVAEEGSEVIAFLVARRLASDIEILNFAVRPDARRKGVGASLLRHALAWAGSFHARQAHLEVRASNAAALRFYESHGFAVTGRRPRYYSAPTEDALLLTATLP